MEDELIIIDNVEQDATLDFDQMENIESQDSELIDDEQEVSADEFAPDPSPIPESVEIEYFETDDSEEIPDQNSTWIQSPTSEHLYVWVRSKETYEDESVIFSQPSLLVDQYSSKPDEDITQISDLEVDEPEEREPDYDHIESSTDYTEIEDWVNQTGIFNLLTNNGTANGIYMQEDKNGVNQLYINMTYARSGVLQVGGSENSLGVFQVLDENNQDIGHWDKQGIMLNGGVIQSKDNKSWWNLSTGTLNLNGYITSYKTEYAVGGSMTEAPTSGWSQTAPTQVPEGQYIWQRSTLKRTGDADQVKTVCLSGKNGIDGRGIRSANIQYYLSTSNERLEGGSWSDAAPSYVKDRYYWTRTKTIYTDGVTEYSDSVLDMGLTDANRIAADANASATLAHESSQQAKADAADAKTASTQAQSDAALAQGAATRAETSASQAATSAQNASNRADEAEAAATNAQTQASNAAMSASTAQTRANEAAQSATRAQGSASRAETAATNAQTQASNAATAASQAKADAKTAKDKAEQAIQDAADAASAASQAQTSADNAQSSADAAAQAASRANTTANGAVTSLGILQGVVDNLGDDVDDLQTHVAMMDAITDENGKVIVPSGLHVVPTSNGYFVVVSNDGMYVYDPQSVLVATFGENINFNSYRPQRIGGADAYIEYYDSNNDGKADALRIIGAKVDITGGTKIQSNNFQASQNASSPYSATGTFLDLSNGRLYMPNFGVDADGKAYINGEIIATSGKIGEDSTSYWEIGTQTDYNNDDSAALIGHGTSFIQTGDFQLSNGLLNTRSYTANHQITYPKYNNTYWDFGAQAPTLDTSTSGYVAGIDDNFFYIRNHANTIPALKTDWNYLYRVDKNGNIYTTGQVYINGQSLDQLYASISDVDSSFLPTTGGTINGNLTVTGSINGTATKATQLTHTLSINNKTWDGSANTDVGTIGVAYGGTGGTTFTSGAALIGNGQGAFQTRAITNNTAVNYITANTNLITANTLKFWNGSYDSSHTSNLEYVKQGKLGTVVTHDLEDFITTEGGIIDGSLAVTDLNAGSLVVTGAARFTNAIYGDLTGNADTADKVNHDLIIKLNSGTTEGTNMFTFNGNAAKTINVTKSAIGLGNVENTALSTWAGSANLTTTKVGTLAAAAIKGVDTSIAAASTSGNLPTSAAVAAFVEGKGYVTSSGVTSVRVQATSPVVSSVNTAQSSTLNTTISLADGYGDTKNPYASKTKNYVLAAPSDANGAPTFRALVADDIPTLTPSKVGLGNVTNNKQIKGLSSGTTNGHLVTWGADGYTVADSGIVANNVKKTVTTLASNNDGKLVLTYLDGTTSDPIEVKIIGSSGSSVSYADALNVGGTAVGSASKPVFINAQGKPQAANTIPTVTLNGSATTSASFYAPTTVGTNGQYLKSNGSGAPTWATFSKSTVGLGNVDNTADADKAVKSATKATQDSDGHAINTTYLKRSGGVLTVADGVSVTAPMGTVVKVNANSIIQSPIPKYLWHDVWGFCKATTPKYYITTDGTTWTEATLEKRLFAHMEAWGRYNIIEVDGKSGSRWEWDGGGFAYCSGAWLVIGVAYSATMAKFNVLLEQSSGTGESAEWKTLCESNNISVNQQPIWIKTNGSNENNIRLTITRNAESATSTNLPIVALRWLTFRWGDQGKGSEFEYPYSWDGEGNMTAKGTFTGTFNGNATTATSATKATQDGSGNTITSTYVNVDGSNKMTGNLTIRKVGTGANDWASRTNNPSLIFETTDGQSAGFVFTQYDSVQAPSSVTLVGNSDGAYFIAPNIKATGSFYGNLSGNATSATKATQDGSGNTITSTYVNLTGAQTISGTKTFSAMPVASAGLCVGNSGTAGGLSLWSDKDVKRYGLALRLTSDSGKHGYVQGDYATYNYMYSASDTGVYTRGWIFKDSVHDKGVASISGAGNAVFNGSVTVGGNASNTSGWRLEKDENLDCLNFIFVA